MHHISYPEQETRLLSPSNSLSLQELIIAPNTTKATEATALPTTVGQHRLIMNGQRVDVNGTRGEHVSRVIHKLGLECRRDPNLPRLNLLRDAQPAEQVTCEHGSCQAVLGVIGECYGVLLGVDDHQRHGRTE